MKRSGVLATVAVALLGLIALVPQASAFKVVSQSGEAAGQTRNPVGVAVDRETGRLYVADAGNHRIDVFDTAGSFVMAFGWGVDTGASALQICTTASTCQKGLAGAGKGQFNGPTSIAVDNDPLSPSFHDVYVADFNNHRVEKFSPTGEFILTYGGGVNQTKVGEGKTSEENVCLASSGDICGAGRNGTGGGEFFDSEIGGQLLVGVGPGGIVYVGDSQRIAALPAELFTSRLQKFDPNGAFIFQKDPLAEGSMVALAVDSTGDFYAATERIGRTFQKYDSTGNSIISSIGKGEFLALATGANDHIYMAENDATASKRNISEYDSSGNPLRRFGYGTFESARPKGLVPHESPSGDIYVSEGDRVIQVDFPPPGPVVLPAPCKAGSVGSGRATLQAEVNPEGKATTVHFQYLTQAQFEAGGFANPETKTTPESASIGEDIELHEGSVLVTGLTPETKYHCRVVASNEDATVVGSEGEFTTLEPFEILASWSSGVGAEEVTLNANVNPLGIPTTGHFQYVDDATYQADVGAAGPGHGFDHAKDAPEGPGEIDFGAGETPKTGSVTISGLAAGTVYHYRIIVKDPFVAPRPGAEHTFRTFLAGEGVLPDGRAYELVSPAQRNGGEVAVPGGAGGVANLNFVRINAASPSGEAATYTSFNAFANPQGAPGVGQYLSRRTAAGWVTENISPPGAQRLTQPPFTGFSPDLSFGGLNVKEPALGEGAVTDFENTYLRDNASGTLRSLNDEVPRGVSNEVFCLGYGGSSADGSRAFFLTNGALADAPEGTGFSLYERSSVGAVTLVSVLPSDAPAAPASETAFGAGGGGCGSSNRIVAGAVSEDGSKVFWTFGGKYKTSQRPLMARLNGTETIQLDASKGAGPPGNGRFLAATPNGSFAFFSAPGKLTATASEDGLYRYDTATKTPLSLTPGAGSAGVQGILGISRDGSYAYFAANAALTGEATNAQGQKAQAGKANVYLWHQGAPGLRFVATLSESDGNNWSAAPTVQTARVSPDGLHLAFVSLSSETLSGYDNSVAAGSGCVLGSENQLEGGPLCRQAYLFDAETGGLTCASCNPSGARPIGPSLLPGWSNPYEATHYLSADGSRLFFESRDALSPNDQNQALDVYEFERVGSGSCNAQNPSFDPVSDGCHFLISTGASQDQTYLLDASASGRDVFLATRERLVGWDENENYDVYDAREGGGFPEPTPPPPACIGEACKPQVTIAPSSPSAATPSFEGPANKLEKPKKHKARKHRKKHKHKARKHRRANHNRRDVR